MDIILLDRFRDPKGEAETGDAVENIMRERSVKHYYHGWENVLETMIAYPNVNYRYTVQPSGAYPKLWNLLNFSNSTTWPMQMEGREDAKTSLTQGYAGPFGMLELKDWIEDKDGIKEKWGGKFRAYLDSFFE